MARERWAATVSGILCFQVATASGGRGLELYYAQSESWGYVIAVVVIAMYLLGMRQGVSWWRSLLGSAAVLFFGGLFESVVLFCIPHYVQHRLDSDLNPDPLLRALLGSTSSSLSVGIVGAVLWWDLAKRYGHRPERRTAFHAACFCFYLISIFACLGIQLMRDRPYTLLEHQVAADRKEVLTVWVPIALEDRKSYPVARDFPGLLESLRSGLCFYDEEPDLWAAAYEPVYHRFDRREMRRHKIVEWNTALSGKPYLAGGNPWLYAPWPSNTSER